MATDPGIAPSGAPGAGTSVTGTGMKRFQAINHRKFLRRWKDTLAGHRFNGEQPEQECERAIASDERQKVAQALGWPSDAEQADLTEAEAVGTAAQKTDYATRLAKRDIARQMGVPAEHMTVVPIGVDESLFRPLPGIARVPGRLMHTTILGCGIFGSVSGSSAATCATIAKVAPAIHSAINEALYIDRKSTRLNSSHVALSRMPSSA